MEAKKNFDDMNFIEKLKATGPAWMSAGLNVGGATVTNSVILAAATGYMYGWVFAFAVLASYFAIFACVRLTIVTDKNPVALIREKINPTFAWVVALAVLVSNVIFFTIQISLLGDVFQSIVPGISFKLGMGVAIVIAGIIISIPGKSANDIIQKSIQLMIYFLTASYIISLFIVDIDWGELFKGITRFSIPKTKSEVLLFTAVLGSALPINAPFMQAYATKSSKYDASDLKLFKFETAITSLFLLFVQIAVLIVVTSTLYIRGIQPTSAMEAGAALEPFAGKLSTILFALGMGGAALSTMIANTSIQAYIMTDLLQWEVDPRTKKFKTIQFVMLVVGFILLAFGWDAYSVASWGGAFNSLFMPFGILAWFILNNNKELMGKYKTSALANIGIIMALSISALTAIRFIYVNFL
nr:divalent metal cation transporter [Tissierella sp.]